MLSAVPPNNNYAVFGRPTVILAKPFRKFKFNEMNLDNKRRYVCLSVCLSVSMFRMAGQTAGPMETKLDTRTHVHPGSVSVKVNVKVIHVCVRE